MSPKTIQIFLPGGDPQGLRIAEITTRIVRVIDMPRSLIGDFLRMPEAGQVGLYFLIGEDDKGSAGVYIGQSGLVGTRLAQHNQGKDFWNRALIAVSLTNSLTNTHASFLEWLSIKQAAEAGRYSLQNGNGGARPHTPGPLEADCHEIHDTIRILIATLGYPVFESVAKPKAERTEADYFYCRASGADGKGLYTEEGFVVLACSTGRAELVPSLKGTWGERMRERLIEQGVLSQQADRVRFERDQLFNTPSSAAICLTGRNANGWSEWRDSQGRTLDELKRRARNLDPAADVP